MEFNSMLLKLQIKRAIKLIPKLLMGSVMIIVIVVGIVFFGAKNSNEKTIVSKSRIAVVSEGNSFVDSIAIEVLSGMDTISSLFEFIKTDKETALAMLDNSELTAVAVFPETFIEGIDRGDNIPAQIYMKGDKDSFGVSMVAELCDAVQTILTANEASTYAMNDLLIEKGYQYIAPEYDESLDLYSFKQLIERVNNFEQINIVGQNDTTVAQSFVASGLVLLILLMGMACGGIFSSEPKAFEDKLREVKIGHFRQLFYKLIALTVLLLTIYSLVGVLATLFYGSVAEPLKEIYIFDRLGLVYLLICFVPCIIIAACFTMFSFTFADNKIGGILLLFSLTLVGGYVSGLLYPSSYLPRAVLSVQKYFPTTYMHQYTTSAINGELSTNSLAALLVWSLGFYLVSVMIMKYRSRRA